MEIRKLKRELARKNKGTKILSNVELARLMPRLKGKLMTKPVRTGSGVAVVAVMTKPFPCPHGRCSYCPGGVESAFGDVPQSYTGHEPATLRGIRNRYDGFSQVMNRLEQYTLLGHPVGKVELIVMGGTFPSFPKRYREGFILDALHGMNTFSDMFLKNGELREKEFNSFYEPEDFRKPERMTRLQKKYKAIKKPSSLDAEQRKNEKASVRCVAVCIETRPDYCGKRHIDEMLRYGTTRVELGVQHIHDPILKRIERGHDVAESIKATQLMKDSFLKVGYHIMPGLPGSDARMDIEMAEELFSNPDFRPDALKIYPCMVMEGTKLHQEWKKGKYRPLTTKKAVEVISKMIRHVPEYCRIMRVQRDIPTKVTSAGVDRTNLRQYLDKAMADKGMKSMDIRAREPFGKKAGKMQLFRRDYEASKGTEVFLSYEDIKQDTIYGFCRVRMPWKPFRPEITSKCAGIRELHVYGQSAPLGKRGEVQHRGLGKNLVEEAKNVAREYGKREMLVISGIGVREYYRKLGFKRKGIYMSVRI
ncbi:MAG: tRNA uridine(34) 5-carboxymethylaminomethyl modification radical SAM/GNAT enzyme Elp3 [Nanoarchaeota archaeon]|nr:tRNA uridine(34) 5-carboxymethylaminomethyl modification radical SAM/GNAT enzyme Elp3 [Nanoarchaeota archaeon]